MPSRDCIEADNVMEMSSWSIRRVILQVLKSVTLNPNTTDVNYIFLTLLMNLTDAQHNFTD